MDWPLQWLQWLGLPHGNKGGMSAFIGQHHLYLLQNSCVEFTHVLTCSILLQRLGVALATKMVSVSVYHNYVHVLLSICVYSFCSVAWNCDMLSKILVTVMMSQLDIECGWASLKEWSLPTYFHFSFHVPFPKPGSCQVHSKHRMVVLARKWLPPLQSSEDQNILPEPQCLL